MDTSNYEIVITPDERGLAETYPGFSLSFAYNKLGKFLRKRGFTRTAPGHYASEQKVTLRTAVVIFQAMIEKYPWLDYHTATGSRLIQTGSDAKLLALSLP